MRIYLSGLSKRLLLKYRELFPRTKLSILRSFGRPNRENYDFMKNLREHINSLILDSGVYTKNVSTSESRKYITLINYIDYLKDFGKYFDFYFNFDDDFSSQSFDNNWSHQLKIEAAGLNPIPVLHDIDGQEADFYIEKGYKIVAIGSEQSRNLGKLTPIVYKLHSAGIKVHLFGVTKYNYLSSLPVYSCDSSTWTQAGDRGYILYWNSKKSGKDKTDKINLPDYHDDQRGNIYFNDYEYVKDLKIYLKEYFDLKYEDLIGPKWQYNRRIVNTHFFIEIERLVTEEHTRKGFFK